MTTVRPMPPGTELPHRISIGRLRLLLLALLVLVAIIAARTLYLQSAQGRILQEYATSQQQNTQTLPAVRGDILDRNGRELAVGEEAVTFFVTPSLVKEPAATALEISRLLKLPRAEQEELAERLTTAEGGFAYVARQVPRSRAQALIDAELPGVGQYPEERRMYPAGRVAGQLLGRVDIDGVGREGMELLYNNSLTGTPGTQITVRDPQGIPIDVLKLQRERDGRDVQLTLDRILQQEAERVLAATVKRTGAESATAIVMQPRTGEILAMAGVPQVHPERWATAPAIAKRNGAVTDTYEPGSTFKVVAISAALEEGLVTPSTVFRLPPELRFCDEKENCVVGESHARGTQDMSVRDILTESSNVGTIKLAQIVAKNGGGIKAVDAWNARFGFGAPTGIDFPGESAGIMRPVEEWSSVSIGNIPIGQGISVTPIQLASAYAAIANDGVLIQPHLLKRIGDEPVAKHPSRRILSKKTSAQMRNMFEGVVGSDRGTGRAAGIEGYRVGGKTGTAEVAGEFGYVDGQYVASFVGFVPANNPQLVTLVVVNKPVNGYYGGDVAAPAFEEITEFAINRLAIPPDGVL
jgi:cell division protein FtsI (penicillin-binding protein 3)/stage V sporulation protein D (sporulation-specific penicillin-binding protein)